MAARITQATSKQPLLKRLLLGLALLASGLALAEALECYACDSAENAECATRPGQQIEVEECSSETDECITVVTAGLTRRGCLSRLYPNGYCAELCDRCNTSLCNREVYPLDRLRCYQCSGPDCIDVRQRPELLLPCPVYNADDRCYTNIVHMDNTLRGCVYTNLPEACPHVCLKCNYNGCNAELTVGESRCLQCSHSRMAPNADCLRDQQAVEGRAAGGQCALGNSSVTQCVNKVMYGHRERCYTHINTQTEVLQRGCSTTMGFFPTGRLSQCYGELCNSGCEDIMCNVCNSTADADCRAGRNLKWQQCADGTVACYSCEQDTQLRRGCVDGNFTAAANEVCQLCRSGDGCNRWSTRSCYRCNSQEEGDACAHMTSLDSIRRSNCTAATELCVSTVVSRLDLVYTVRGCANEVPECTVNDPYCVRCNGSLCNTAPTQWLEGEAVASRPLLFGPAQPSSQQQQRLRHSLFAKYLWSRD